MKFSSQHDWRAGIIELLSSLCSLSTHSAGKNLPIKQETQETQVQSLGLGRSPGGENSKPLQYSCLENPMDRGTWQAIVHRVARVRHDWMSTHTSLSMWNSKGAHDDVRAGPSTNLEAPINPPSDHRKLFKLLIFRNSVHKAFLGFSGIVYVMDQTECSVH